MSRDKKGDAMQETSSGVRTSEDVFPAMFVDMPYAPVLLFDAHFDATITDDVAFRDACETGFRSYFGEMWEISPNDENVFVDRFYTVALVSKDIKGSFEHVPAQVSLACCAGFWLGWVSAWALVQPKEAQAALDCLLTTVNRVQAGGSSLSARLIANSGYKVSSNGSLIRTCGGDGWPLDM